MQITLNSGYQIPAIGLGTWKSEAGQVYDAVIHALKTGYRHIDCAAAYANEAEVGQALEDSINKGLVTREELFIVSKLWNSQHAAEDVIPALKQTLSDLHLDYLDMYLIHWPVAFRKDVGFATKADEFLSLEQVPIIDTWHAMEKAMELGLSKSIGVSNFSIKKLEHLTAQANIQPATNQVEGHPYLQQNALLDYCHKQGIVLTAYSPLGSMDRPDFLRHGNEPILLQNHTIKAIAEKHNATAAQILLAWALARNTVVIPKSTKPQRIEENYQALDIHLDADDKQSIATLDRNFRYVDGSFFVMDEGPYTLANIWDENA